jgi:hypothetical protein
MGTHSASGQTRAPRVKYVYVSPNEGTDEPVSGPPAPTARKVAEISVWQRFRDVALALLGVFASVVLILGGRVADYALEWHPGSGPSITHDTTTASAQTVDLAPRAFTTSAIGSAQRVLTVHAFAEDDPSWQCGDQGNGKCGKGPVNAN